jgi:hypothetical protein
VAGAIQVILRDWLANRGVSAVADDVPPAPIPGET